MVADPPGAGVPPPASPPPPPPPGAPIAGDAVQLRGLGKRFGEIAAVDAIDLRVPSGSFFAIVGVNGAGKTTTLRMTTGLLRPDTGQVLIEGRDVWGEPESVKARIGVLPDDLRLFDRLRGGELLTYAGLLRGLDAAIVEERAGQLIEVLDLAAAADAFVVDYSHGMRKKIALAAALLHAPQVVFLDEPFEGIDPVSARTIRTVLQRFTAAGGTVVLSSHVMALVEQLCDHVAIIDRGRVVAAGTVAAVAGGRSLEDVFIDLVGGRELGEEALPWLGSSSD